MTVPAQKKIKMQQAADASVHSSQQAAALDALTEVPNRSALNVFMFCAHKRTVKSFLSRRIPSPNIWKQDPHKLLGLKHIYDRVDLPEKRTWDVVCTHETTRSQAVAFEHITTSPVSVHRSR